MFEGYVCEVEVYAFEEEVGGDEYLFVVVPEYGCVVADAFVCGGVLVPDVPGEVLDESEFS